MIPVISKNKDSLLTAKITSSYDVIETGQQQVITGNLGFTDLLLYIGKAKLNIYRIEPFIAIPLNEFLISISDKYER